MKLCFHHQPIDVDVSSGTEHARHQWHELAMGYNVTELAVINHTSEPYLPLNDSLPVTEYPDIESFIQEHATKRNQVVFVEQGDFTLCHKYPFRDDQWIVVGGSAGLPLNVANVQYVSLAASTALYPREAAAIALDSANWRR